MKKSIKFTILAGIIVAGIGGATCGGFTTLNLVGEKDIMTNCQYDELKTALLIQYPTGKEVIHIDDWQLYLAVLDKEIKTIGKMTLTGINKDNLITKIIEQIK